MFTFLIAEWRKLALVNYVVDPELLYPYLPYKTELDLWNGKCYLSLVGFMFLKTRVLGLPVPYHINFEEVNLRFYVKQKDKEGQLRRGVVFIKEVVPKAIISWAANKVYKEHYETMLMKHEWVISKSNIKVAYFWGRFRWNSIWLEAQSDPIEIENGSEAEFITEHFWGYTKVDDQTTNEYQVVHPRWEVYPVKRCYIDVSFDRIYGKEFSFLRKAAYDSVYLAEGSKIKVKYSRKLIE